MALPSHAELPQVMIHMFVHAAAPVLRREGAKKRMRMSGTLSYPALVKSAHAKLELFLFAQKIPLI